MSIHVIQSREHILNTVNLFSFTLFFTRSLCVEQYSEAISRYAERKFMHDAVDLVTSARVSAVHPDKVVYTTKNLKDGSVEKHEIPTNFVLWSTGIAMNPFVRRVSSLL